MTIKPTCDTTLAFHSNPLNPESKQTSKLSRKVGARLRVL